VKKVDAEGAEKFMTKIRRFSCIAAGILAITFVLIVFAISAEPIAQAATPVVRAVLFASPTCPHCAAVKEEVLPPLIARYGSRLQIVTVSTATPKGYELFLSACMKYGNTHMSVPMLVVGSTSLTGSADIPQKFPDLIEKSLASGGVDWPGIPGLGTLMAANPAFSEETQPSVEPPAQESAVKVSGQSTVDDRVPAEPPSPTSTTSVESKPSAATVTASTPAPSAAKSSPQSLGSIIPTARNTVTPSGTPPAAVKAEGSGLTVPAPPVQAPASGMIDLTSGEAEMGIFDRIKLDIYGNGLAILVLVGMILTLIFSPSIYKRQSTAANPTIRPRYDWLIPILILAGLGIAAYLSHVEVSKVEAVCGPVGDCNTVNQSKYAQLFGILPIGVLGMLGFLAILAAWALRRWGPGRLPAWAAIAIMGMTGFGTLFSIYLTFLEPFVIGATCLWCLSSAVIMTVLFALSLKSGRKARALLAQSSRADH